VQEQLIKIQRSAMSDEKFIEDCLKEGGYDEI